MLRRNGLSALLAWLSLFSIMQANQVQSCTACADGWIVDKETGIIVQPEDPELIVAAI